MNASEAEELMGTVYVTRQDSLVRKEGERLRVTYMKEKLLDVPLIQVEQVVCFGRVTITPAAVETLLNAGVSMTILTEHGRFVGRIEPAFSKNAALRHNQYLFVFDVSKKLKLAQSFVSGKIANLRTGLVRARRRDWPVEENEIERMKGLERRVREEEHASTDIVRGLEGAASAIYFGQFGNLIDSARWTFPGRVRRPPTDPVNALLSFGYVLLANDVWAAVETVGLDPYAGFLHEERYGRPSLAMDMMEEFRAPIVDSVVCTCLNKGILGPDDFETQLGGAVRLKDAGRKKFLEQYEKRKSERFIHPLFGYEVDFKRCFLLQARVLARVLGNELEEYIPFERK